MDNYQMNFELSRAIDFQKNLDTELMLKIVGELFDKKNLLNQNFYKHANFIITELFFCWLESENQFLSVSMSKRGYRSKSRYNPSELSSYSIKLIKYLKDANLIDFQKGFYDTRTKRGRLSRIRANSSVINYFRKIKLKNLSKIDHKKREYVYFFKDKNYSEYRDNFRTHELREILKVYNKIIKKNFFDIPCHHENQITRYDNKEINLSILNSTLNCCFYDKLDEPYILNGCWWNKLHESNIMKYKRNFIINNSDTGYIDLLEFFPIFLLKFFETKIDLTSSYSDNFSYNEKCNLILKLLRSKNHEFFKTSILREKKRYGLGDFNNENLRKMLNLFIEQHGHLSIYLKDKNINWDSFCSEIFIELLKTNLNFDNPIYLLKDKIYFSVSHQKSLISNLVKILEKKFKVREISIKIELCKELKSNKSKFLNSFLRVKENIAGRYIKNLKNFERNIKNGS